MKKIKDLFEYYEAHPKHVLIEGKGKLTAKHLTRRVRQITALFDELEIGPGERIFFSSSNDIETASFFLACVRSGRVAILLEPSIAIGELKRIYDKAKPKAAFLEGDLYSQFIRSDISVHVHLPFQSPGGKLIDKLMGTPSADPSYLGRIEQYPSDTPMATEIPEADSPCLIIATSGSSGGVKLVPLTQRNILAQAVIMAEPFALTPDSRFMNFVPLSHSDGVMMGIFLAFFAKSRMIRTPRYDSRSMEAMISAIHLYEPTHIVLVPAMLKLMLLHIKDLREALDASALKVIISTAAHISKELWKEFETKTGKKVLNVYGLTESGNPFTTPVIGTIGKPLGVEAKICEDFPNEVKKGEMGELWISGDCITPGYLGQSIDEFYREDGGKRYFRTGDHVYEGDNGNLVYLGRKKTLIISAGRNIHPEEVNLVLMESPDVEEAATFGVSDEIWGERAISAVVPASSLSPEELKDRLYGHLKLNISDHKIPRELFFLESFPKLRSGKVKVNDLKQIYLDQQERSSKSETLTATNQLERYQDRILKIASHVFRTQSNELSLETRPGDISSWDSLAHLDFICELENEFSIKLDVDSIVKITSIKTAGEVVRDLVSK